MKREYTVTSIHIGKFNKKARQLGMRVVYLSSFSGVLVDEEGKGHKLTWNEIERRFS